MNPQELPKGYRPVEYAEPEAAKVAADFLSDPKGTATNRMRKNMNALRSRVAVSVAPIVRIEDTEGKCHGYAWNTLAKLDDDVKLERRLKQRSVRQLIHIRDRAAKHSVAADRRADKATAPKRIAYFRQRAEVLRNISSAAKFELMERTGESVFKNPDGN